MLPPIDIDKILSRYQSRLNSQPQSDFDPAVYNYAGDSVRLLPPYLCRQINRKELLKDFSQSYFYTGNSQSKLRKILIHDYELNICLSDLNLDVLSELNLWSFDIKVPSERLLKELEDALIHLESIYAPAWKTVSQQTSMIVWLTPKKMTPPEDLFSCCSFHQLPHCTFLTDLALRHIPANVVFKKNSTYALQENLYHESLHQELCEIIDNHNLFLVDRSELLSIQVSVPWRATEWALEKAVHAFYVYAHLLKMRSHVVNEALVSEDFEDALEKGILEAKRAVTELGNGIVSKAKYLSKTGFDLVSSLL